MEYRYDSAVGEVVFRNHTITLKGKVIPYEKIKSFDYEFGSDYTTFFINNNKLKVYGVRKAEADEIKQTITYSKGETDSIVKQKETEEKTQEEKTVNGELWRARKLTWFGLPWTFTVYRLTEHRFFVDSGVLSKEQTELRLYRILDIRMRRGFIQRIFKMGSITLVSNDKDTPEYEIKNIKEPQKIKDLISDKVEEERKRNNVRMGEFMNGEGFAEF